MGRSFLVLSILFALLTCVNYCQGCFDLQFVCGDGKCLNRNNDDNGVCDGRVDCSDGSDESRCGLGQQYICTNGQLISGGSVCDGNDDCGDNSDEMQCGNINLVGMIVGVTLGAVALGLCCPLCIILGVMGCVFCVLYRQKKIDRNLRAKNIPINTGGTLGSAQQQHQQLSPSAATPSVEYTKPEEKVNLVKD